MRDEDERSNDGEKEEREDENPVVATKLVHRRMRFWFWILLEK